MTSEQKKTLNRLNNLLILRKNKNKTIKYLKEEIKKYHSGYYFTVEQEQNIKKWVRKNEKL